MVGTNETNTFSDVIARLVQERERLNLTQSQFACLAGVSCEFQASLEAGKWDRFPMDYVEGAKHTGVDFVFVLGDSTEPRAFPEHEFGFGSPAFRDVAFFEALQLMRKSIQAVNAFAGNGTAEKCPQLVAATMQAAISARYACGPGDMEELADKISGAISDLGEAIQTALPQND